LGIAASQISNASTLSDLHSDFNKINDILASLVDDVQKDLGKIWPTLLKILKWTKKVDDFLIDFSMNLARDGAWKFANELSAIEGTTSVENMISERDLKISEMSKLITNHGFFGKLMFRIIRFGERGKPSDRIKVLKNN
jgi:hypothetical protein